MFDLDRSQWIGIGVIALGVTVVLWILVAVLRRQVNRAASRPESAYTKGLTAMIEGNRREALRHLKQAVQFDSENLDAYIRMGDLLRESGRAKQALSVHRDLTVRPRLTDHDRARILESLSFDQLALDQYEEAGLSAERLRRLDKRHTGALVTLQRVAEAQGDWKKAVEAVDERIRTISSNEGQAPEAVGAAQADYRCTVARRQSDAGDTEAAKQNLEQALQKDANCFQAHLLLGDLAQKAGDARSRTETLANHGYRGTQSSMAGF